MNIALKGAGLLSLLLFVGMGCTPTAQEPTTLTGSEDATPPAAMMEENDSDEDSMDGETLLKDDAMEQEDSMEKDDTMVGEDAMMKDDTAMEKNDDTAMMEQKTMVKGSYETYSADKLALAETGDVVLFFHAGWCPSCKTLDKNITANASSIPDGLTILKTDYDTEKALKKKYGVTYQHTMVQVDKDGNLIKKWSGGNTLDGVVKQVQ